MMMLVMMMRMITTMVMMITIMMMSVCVCRWAGGCSLARSSTGVQWRKQQKIQTRDGEKNAETYEGNYMGKKFANDIKDEAGNYMDNEK